MIKNDGQKYKMIKNAQPKISKKIELLQMSLSTKIGTTFD